MTIGRSIGQQYLYIIESLKILNEFKLDYQITENTIFIIFNWVSLEQENIYKFLSKRINDI